MIDSTSHGDPRLLLGPILRHVDATSATLWVEVDRPCTVRVDAGGATASTSSWGVHGHHYAILAIDGLEPASTTPYSVSLSARGPAAGPELTVWPPQQDWTFPPSAIRTARPDATLRLSFGSCRRAEPLDAHGVSTVGPDALVAMALRLADLAEPGGSGSTAGAEVVWPDVLLMAGDQLYADEPSESVIERLHASQRAPGERGEGGHDVRDEICTFEEYTWLYEESWSPPAVRWLLSNVATCMLLDDHDLRDDWNTSKAWREDFSRLPWFDDRVRGALGSYWVYQHLGNLAPAELAAEPLLAALQGAADDTERGQLLDDFARRADSDPDSARWSYVRDFGSAEHGVRLVAVDCRCSRRLDPARRGIVDDAEWEWLAGQLSSTPDGGRVDHLLMASTLPALMVPVFSDIESWNETMTAGRWGSWAARGGEWLRRATDLEHWPAFRASLDDLLALLRRIVDAPGAPASILLLAGDVHCSYTARAQLDGGDHAATAVHQLVMSPFRNPLKPALRLANRAAVLAPVRAAVRALVAAAGVSWPAARWSVDDGPWFENGVMTIVIEGRHARLEIDHVRAVKADPAARWERRTTRRSLTP